MTNCLPPQILSISGLSKSQQKTTTSVCFRVSIPRGWGAVGGGRRCAAPGPCTALRASLPPEGVQPQTLGVSAWANDDHVLF